MVSKLSRRGLFKVLGLTGIGFWGVKSLDTKETMVEAKVEAKLEPVCTGSSFAMPLSQMASASMCFSLDDLVCLTPFEIAELRDAYRKTIMLGDVTRSKSKVLRKRRRL